MDARPLLHTVARVLAETGLEAILIGNAAAALQGAPVTTIDFDFLIRKTPRNAQRLKAVAKALDAVLFRQVYPRSDAYRVMRDEDGLQLRFSRVASTAAIQTYTHNLGDFQLAVEKQAVRHEKSKPPTRKQMLAALKAESDQALIDMIRRLLAKPLNERTHFLRKRVGYRASCL